MAYHTEGGGHDEREHCAAVELEEREMRSEEFPQSHELPESSYGPKDDNGQAAFLYARLRPVVVGVMSRDRLKDDV